MSQGTIQPNEFIGPYRVVAKIGEGGMGEVYEAFDEQTGRRVAIKIALNQSRATEEAVSRFKDEARALAKLTHPNIVQLYFAGEHQGRPYLAMEFIDGQPLSKFLANHPCALPETIALFKQMLQGLAAAHDANIIHRDIKPDNLMIDREGVVKLVDFGIAKSLELPSVHKTSFGIVIGTKNYLAPELLKGKPADHRSDIYSLGLVLQTMLSGEVPPPLDLRSSNEVSSVQAIVGNPLIPPELKRIWSGMIHPAAELRYAAVSEILKDLESITITKLAPDLMATCRHDLEVENLHEVIQKCKSLGLDYTEAQMVANLTIQLNGVSPSENENSNKTEIINFRQKVRIDVNNIPEVSRRVREAKGLVLGERISKTSVNEISSSEPVSISQKSKINIFKLYRTASLFASLILAIYVYFNFDSQAFEAFIRERAENIAKLNARLPASEKLFPTNKKNASPLQESYQLPKLPIGTTLVYQIKFSESQSNQNPWVKKRELQLQEYLNNGHSQKWTDQNGEVDILYSDLFLPPLIEVELFNLPRKKHKLIDLTKSNFPLAPGARSQVPMQATDVNSGAVETFLWECEVADRLEPYNSPIGPFDTIRVDCHSNASTKIQQTTYYSPKLQMWLKRETNVEEKSKSYTILAELNGYSLKSK